MTAQASVGGAQSSQLAGEAAAVETAKRRPGGPAIDVVPVAPKRYVAVTRGDMVADFVLALRGAKDDPDLTIRAGRNLDGREISGEEESRESDDDRIHTPKAPCAGALRGRGRSAE